MRTKNESPLRFLEGRRAGRLVELYFEICHLKQLFRQGWLRAGVPERACESVAEHSFGVALLALVVAEERFPALDAGKAVKIALLHDLAEARAGDITLHDGVPPEEKERREREGIEAILAGLPNGDEYRRIWEEYEAQSSPEAVLVKQLDRLEMALQASVYEHQTGADLGPFFDSARRAMVWEELQAIFAEVEASRPGAGSAIAAARAMLYRGAMHAVWETFKEAGFVAWLVLLVGMMGGALALVAVILAALRSRATLWVGAATALLGAIAAGLGGAGVMYGRSIVDGAIAGESVSPIFKERLQREGYREARSAAKIGLLFALLPLLAGTATMFASPRRRPPEVGSPLPDAPIPDGPTPAPAPVAGDGPGLGVPIGVTAFGLLCTSFTFATLRSPLPGRDIPFDDPVWRVLEEVDKVQHVEAKDKESDELGRACKRLEEALPADPASPDPALMPDFPAAARKCVDERRKQAAVLSPISAVQREIEAIAKSPIVQHDAELRRAVEADLAEVKKIAETSPPEPGGVGDPFGGPASSHLPKIRMGAVKVSGRLPPEVIQRIVRQNFGRFRLCYENGLRANPSLQGRVVVRFVIGRDGAVSNIVDGGSDLPDKGVTGCVTRAFYGLSFPQPEGGIVTVSYPIMFSPPG